MRIILFNNNDHQTKNDKRMMNDVIDNDDMCSVDET